MFIIGLIAYAAFLVFFVLPMCRAAARGDERWEQGGDIPRWVNSAHDAAMEYLLHGPQVQKW